MGLLVTGVTRIVEKIYVITCVRPGWYKLFPQLVILFSFTAISRKVVGKNVHAIIPKGNMGYDQYTAPDSVAVEPTFVAFL